MPVGLQVFDANGNLEVDLTTRLTRIVGYISTTTTDGYLTVSIPSNTTLFVCVIPHQLGSGYRPPDVKLENNSTIRWAYHGNTSWGKQQFAKNGAATIYYGYF